MRKFSKVVIILLLCVVLSGISLIYAIADEETYSYQKVQATQFPNGMVSSARQLASEAGVEVLKNGGNAVDAAATTQFVLNVTFPSCTGIGGGCFIMISDESTGEVFAIDGREEAPELYTEDVFLDNEGNVIPFSKRRPGGNSAGVPGTLAAWNLALEKFGTISLTEALEPAIRIAEEGFPLSASDAKTWANKTLSRFPSSVEIFHKPDGSLYKEGEVWRNPDLAETFRLIASEGIDAFYKGEIAADIVKVIQEDTVNPGVMALNDLAGYRAVLREPVRGEYRGYEIVAMSPPTSGGTAMIEMLNISEAFNLGQYEFGDPDGVHLINEAQKVAYADRNRYLGDSDWVDVPLDTLLSKEFAAVRRDLINPYKAIPTPAPYGEVPSGAPISQFSITDTEGVSTTHFSVVDRSRDMVACTTTIEGGLGCYIVVPGRGFLLNNELTDFDAKPYFEDGTPAPNRPEGGKMPRITSLDAQDTIGGKRPRSSMCPTLIFKDGTPYMTLGTPGGSTIFGKVFDAIVNVIDFGMDPQQAIFAPIILNRNGDMGLQSELFEQPELVSLLEARGHKIKSTGRTSLCAIMVEWDTGMLLGGALEGGYVAGY